MVGHMTLTHVIEVRALSSEPFCSEQYKPSRWLLVRLQT